jgi:hypothetical protein
MGAVTVYTPCYCSREDVQRAADFADTAIDSLQVDRAIQSVARTIESHLHRVFYPIDAVYKFDWPDSRGTAPWRIWFGQWDLITASEVTSGGVAVPIDQVFFLPNNRRPGYPFTHLELDLSTSATFSGGNTPQLSVAVTGTWGFTDDSDPAGTLTADITDTTSGTVTVSNGAACGVGDLLIVGTERMIVSDKKMASTGVSFAGFTSDTASDNVLAVADGTVFAVGEVLQFDAERCLVTDITGNNLTVKRAWDGTVLAAHTSGTIYAARSLTVLRGQLGSTAATHDSGDTVSRHRPPSLVRDLAIAEAVNRVLQETSGYARTVGGPDMAMPAPGGGLADLWAEAVTGYGRQARKGVI